VRPRPRWERAARRIASHALRQVGSEAAFAALERAARAWARLGLAIGGGGLPPSVRRYPAAVAPYLGAAARRDPGALIRARARFLAARLLVNQLVALQQADGRERLGPIAVDGAGQLADALAERRGLIVVSAHFGLPPLIRPVLEERRVRVIGVGAPSRPGVDVPTGRDLWARARALRRLQGALAEGAACVFLADVRHGRYVEAPFLDHRIPVASGAFGLARVTGSPVLPLFATHSDGVPRFRVHIGPRLPAPGTGEGGRFAEPARAFARCYERVARAYPEQLLAYEPLFSAARRAARPGRPARPTAPGVA
jgi:lauroyl/myristoyl acyltransferase